MLVAARLIGIRAAQPRRGLRPAAIAVITLIAAVCCAAPACATVPGHNGPIAYLDMQGDIMTINANGTGQHILVAASSLPGYALAVAGSGAWSSGSDPELLFLAQSTKTSCIDYGCSPTPQVRLYREPASGGKPQLLAADLGYIQSASWWGTSTHEIVVSTDNATTNATGNQVFGLDMFSVTAAGYLHLPVQGFDVDATDTQGYIDYAHGNENFIPAATASPDGPWEGCTTNFSTGRRQCRYQSGPTPPCSGPGYMLSPCPSAPTATLDYRIGTGVFRDRPGANPLYYGPPGPPDYAYGVTSDPANNVPTFVSERDVPLLNFWVAAWTFSGSTVVQTEGATAPSMRWAWSPNGQEIARSLNGALAVYNASNLGVGRVIASGLALSPGFPYATRDPSLRNAGSVIAWGPPRSGPSLPSKPPSRRRRH